jgi:hypothetical protein
MNRICIKTHNTKKAEYEGVSESIDKKEPIWQRLGLGYGGLR